ncbi:MULTISPECIES: esterase/lipase family protein [Stutzerimonas stutzeri subgroup]|uniref:esterase/lipase family protein n=1 Tax=Stutzerimonas stutzeri subgroup TaxID=578833 RepID=UPI00289F0755|nr:MULTISPECIES: alpha/beta hydrolase [Stutzerimonas stutzeri subgroup]
MGKIVIVHGWSDDSKSFRKLSDQLASWFGSPPLQIHLADWISLQDDVTYSDLVEAMDRAWYRMNLPRTPRSVDIVTHSTGALVVRDWMTRFFAPKTVPIMRFLMLAPANFGSPLAHTGQSFLGRVIKGWNKFIFQTGTQVLKGLELGSPYTVQLAQRDLFDPANTWYGAGKVLATVLVGNTGYDGIEAIANEDGGDGTVRISTANLNAHQLVITLDQRQKAENWTYQQSNGAIGFAIVDRENHSTIALKGSNGTNNPTVTLALIQQALSVTDNDYQPAGDSFAWQQQLNASTTKSIPNTPRMQNLITHVQDHLGQDVLEYLVQLYRKVNNDRVFEGQLYQNVIRDVHPYGDNPSYRSLYLSIDKLDQILAKFRVPTLYLSISAHPIFKPPRQPVGYAAVGPSEIDGLGMPAENISQFFSPHRSLIVQLRIQRMIGNSVFALT